MKLISIDGNTLQVSLDIEELRVAGSVLNEALYGSNVLTENDWDLQMGCDIAYATSLLTSIMDITSKA
jgi:nitrogen fixation protein